MAALSPTSAGSPLKFEITNLWNGEPIPPSNDHKINAQIAIESVANVLTISVLSSFYYDPSPPQIPGPDQSYMNLWPYEIAELFFYSSESQKYLQILLSPHGQYLVLLSNGTKNHINSGYHIEYSAQIDTDAGTWKGQAKIPVELLPPKVDRFMAAYLHGNEDHRQVETLYPIPGDKPDLHQPDKFGEINLEGLLPGFRQQSELSDVWQRALDHPMITQIVYYMWDGSSIETNHNTHKNVYCTLFFRGVEEGLGMDVICPFFDDPPPAGGPGPTDQLWEHEVAEAFFLAASPNGTNRYIEIELGPYGHHIVLLLDGQRNAIAKLLPIEYQAIIDGITNVWVGSAIIPAAYFPPGVNKFMVTAVHNTGKTPEEVKYEVMSAMPGEAADFHRLDKYVDIAFSNLLPGNDNATLSTVWEEALENPIETDKN